MNPRSARVRWPFSRRRSIAIALVAGLFTTYLVRYGVPIGRLQIGTWCLLGITVLTPTTAPLALLAGFARNWLPFLVLLAGYDFVRGHADSTFEPHFQPQLGFDALLVGGSSPTAWLQQHFYQAGNTSLWDGAALVIYLSHFIVPFALAVVLFSFRYPAFRRFVSAYVVLTLLGLATYAAYPAAPPWMAADLDMIPAIHHVIPATVDSLGIQFAADVYGTGKAYANPVAALPSLHAAYPALLCFLYWSHARWLRWALLTYMVSMGLVLVYSGEHYVFDVIVGWAYAGATVYAVNRWRNRGQRVESEAAPSVASIAQDAAAEAGRRAA